MNETLLCLQCSKPLSVKVFHKGSTMEVYRVVCDCGFTFNKSGVSPEQAIKRYIDFIKGIPEEELWNADTNCKHNIVNASGGGVRCTKCGGWCCY